MDLNNIKSIQLNKGKIEEMFSKLKEKGILHNNFNDEDIKVFLKISYLDAKLYGTD